MVAVVVSVTAVLLMSACSRSGGLSEGDSTSPTVVSAPPTASPRSAAPASPKQNKNNAKIPAKEQNSMDEQLRQAAWKNDVKAAASLIEKGADVNAQDHTQQSAYLIATSEGYLELLNLALENGALINDKDSWNGTGLIRAAERGHYLVVGRLLQAGIDKDHVNRIGFQAVHESVWLGKNDADYAATIRALIAGGVELGMESVEQGLTPLEMAQRRGFADSERILTEATTDRKIGDADATLLTAAKDGDATLVARALRAGADIEARDSKQRTALLLAVTEGKLATARLLVAMGADPDAVDAQSDTPWLVTGVTGSVEMAEVLLPVKPDLTLTNRYGGTSIIPASERGHVDYVRRIAKTDIDLDHVNRLGWTALLEAVILGDGGQQHQQIVEILLKAGADKTIADSDGVTALEHARSRGQADVVMLLR